MCRGGLCQEQQCCLPQPPLARRCPQRARCSCRTASVISPAQPLCPGCWGDACPKHVGYTAVYRGIMGAPGHGGPSRCAVLQGCPSRAVCPHCHHPAASASAGGSLSSTAMLHRSSSYPRGCASWSGQRLRFPSQSASPQLRPPAPGEPQQASQLRAAEPQRIRPSPAAPA
eukprot:COSAG06_NODE_2784_length_6289_cov_6.795153_1_plen_171_part_00